MIIETKDFMINDIPAIVRNIKSKKYPLIAKTTATPTAMTHCCANPRSMNVCDNFRQSQNATGADKTVEIKIDRLSASMSLMTLPKSMIRALLNFKIMFCRVFADCGVDESGL